MMMMIFAEIVKSADFSVIILLKHHNHWHERLVGALLTLSISRTAITVHLIASLELLFTA